MIITKKHLSRRTILRGIGASLALPMLDSMMPALSAVARTPGLRRRMAVVYTPNGMMMPNWTPRDAGQSFEFSPILQALAPHRDQVLSSAAWRISSDGPRETRAPATTRARLRRS